MGNDYAIGLSSNTDHANGARYNGSVGLRKKEDLKKALEIFKQLKANSKRRKHEAIYDSDCFSSCLHRHGKCRLCGGSEWNLEIGHCRCVDPGSILDSNCINALIDVSGIKQAAVTAGRLFCAPHCLQILEN
jgi:hypothetical protein